MTPEDDTAEATGWFEPLYAQTTAAGSAPPWNLDGPRAPLEAWARERGVRGEGRSAAVVGAGLGADAEYVASLGFHTLGFDVSPTAVRVAAERSTHPNARYAVGDLFALPGDWIGAFDLVVESFTAQALPADVRPRAIAAISSLVAPGGTLLVIAHGGGEGDDPDDGPPWPLSRAEIQSFGTLAEPPLALASLERVGEWALWRAELTAPTAASGTFADPKR
jgi:SAM-dependent methyltransferase